MVIYLSEIKENWIFTQNIGATSYWFEETDDGTGETIGPEEVLELGCQLEAELEERTHQYHLAHAKILSREAIIKQLSESELAKDVTKLEAENERRLTINLAFLWSFALSDHVGDATDAVVTWMHKLGIDIGDWQDDTELLERLKEQGIEEGIWNIDALKEGE